MPVEGINENKSVDPYVNLQGLGQDVDDAALQERVAEVAPLLAQGLSISLDGQRYDLSIKDGKLRILTDAPELEDAEAIGAEVDLAALVAYLQMEDTQSQLEVAKKRIEVTKGRIEADHEVTKNKCNETLEKAKEAEAKAAKSRIFGIISMVLSLALTVVLSALTMGAGGVAAALLVTGFLVGMQASGANEAIVNAIVKDGDKDKKIGVAAGLFVAELAISICRHEEAAGQDQQGGHGEDLLEDIPGHRAGNGEGHREAVNGCQHRHQRDDDRGGHHEPGLADHHGRCDVRPADRGG